MQPRLWSWAFGFALVGAGIGDRAGALDADTRAELETLVERHAAGLVPLIVPVTLLRHHIRRCGISYLAGQQYLDPHPAELMLRNHV